MRDYLLAFVLAIAAATADPRSLRLTLDIDPTPGVPHAPRTARINFRVVLHLPQPTSTPNVEFERPRVDTENRDIRNADHVPGPNVELHAVRVEGTRRTEVPIRVHSSGSGGSSVTDYQFVDITIPSLDGDARFATMLTCLAGVMPSAADPKSASGLRSYVIDSEPGTYEITASYRATTWPKRTPQLVSPSLSIVIDDGIDGYQQFCAVLRTMKKP
jgi:hypothetical protein